MARTRGSLDADYALKRAAILNKLKPRLLEGSSQRISFSEMAAIAEISIPTLRHYFPTRSNVVAALLEQIGEEGRSYINLLAVEPNTGLKESLQAVGQIIENGIRRGQTIEIHGLGLNEGIGDTTIGPSYLASILEPTLQALEARLKIHIARGEISTCDVRFAALNFVAPLLVAWLHQGKLGGTEVRPMQIEALVAEQIAIFMKAYGVERPKRKN